MTSKPNEVRVLAERACGTSPDSPEYRKFIAAMTPTLALDLTAQPADQQGEPVAWQLCVEGYKPLTLDRLEFALSERDHYLEGGRTAEVFALYRHPQHATAKVDMNYVMRAIECIPGMPMLTSNQCAALAKNLNGGQS